MKVYQNYFSCHHQWKGSKSASSSSTESNPSSNGTCSISRNSFSSRDKLFRDRMECKLNVGSFEEHLIRCVVLETLAGAGVIRVVEIF